MQAGVTVGLVDAGGEDAELAEAASEAAGAGGFEPEVEAVEGLPVGGGFRVG